MSSMLSEIVKAEGGKASTADLERALSVIPASDQIVTLFASRATDPSATLEGHRLMEAWNFYGDLCRTYWRSRNPNWLQNESFSREHFLEGNFREDLVVTFVAEAMSSPVVPFRMESAAG